MTRYAQKILSIIEQSRDHLSADDIYRALKKECPGVVVATVYNNLKAMTERGQIVRISMEGSPDRYDKMVRHDHLVCKKCGKLSDVFLGDLTKELKERFGEDFISYDLRVNYICPDCKKRG